MTERKRTDFIAIHCSATPADMDVGEKEIRKWHKARGWKDIGYNAVIRRSGRIEIGRPLDHRGAHVAGFNSVSCGVCMIGGVDDAGDPENNFTPAQWKSLRILSKTLALVYPGAKFRGHRDFPNVSKACPCFAAIPWAAAEGLNV